MINPVTKAGNPAICGKKLRAISSATSDDCSGDIRQNNITHTTSTVPPLFPQGKQYLSNPFSFALNGLLAAIDNLEYPSVYRAATQ